MSGRAVNQKQNQDGSVTTTYDDGSTTTSGTTANVVRDSDGHNENNQLGFALRDEASPESLGFRFGNSVDGLSKFTGRTDNLAGQFGAEGYNRPTQNVNANQSRGLQLAAANGYQSMVNGTGPSLANSQLNRGLSSAAMGSSQAMAANPGNFAAQRAAMMNGNAMATQANMGAVGQRVNEFNAGATGVNNGSSAMYSGDQRAYSNERDYMLDDRKMRDDASIFYDTLGGKAREIEMNAQNNRANTRLGVLENALKNDEEQQEFKNERRNIASKAAINATKATAEYYAKASDRRVKENVKPGGNDTREMLDFLSAKTYNYKPDTGLSTEPEVGIMAQDLEKSKMGKGAMTSLNIAGKDRKAIDIGKGLGLALAAGADLNDRLKKLEGK